MSFTNEQKQAFTFDVKDGMDRLLIIDGEPMVTSSDETVVAVTVDNGVDNTWVITAAGVAPGTARIVVQADVDRGAGVEMVTGTADIEVTLDPRTGQRMVELVPGEVTDKAL